MIVFRFILKRGAKVMKIMKGKGQLHKQKQERISVPVLKDEQWPVRLVGHLCGVIAGKEPLQ